jgi:hypothetical protein
MSDDRLCPVDEHLPEGKPKGCVLVVSDYRLLNLGHAFALCDEGYAVYTAVTCTDVPMIFERYHVGDVDLVAFASLVHGWHHLEREERPESIPQTTDPEWQTRNMREVIDIVCGRQTSPPKVLIAVELVTFGWYRITAEVLEKAGVEYEMYSASDPYSIVGFLQ